MAQKYERPFLKEFSTWTFSSGCLNLIEQFLSTGTIYIAHDVYFQAGDFKIVAFVVLPATKDEKSAMVN